MLRGRSVFPRFDVEVILLAWAAGFGKTSFPRADPMATRAFRDGKSPRPLGVYLGKLARRGGLVPLQCLRQNYQDLCKENNCL